MFYTWSGVFIAYIIYCITPWMSSWTDHTKPQPIHYREREIWDSGLKENELHNMMICWYDHLESGGSHSSNMHCHKINSNIARCWETRFSLLCFPDHCLLDTWLDSAYFRQPPIYSLSDVFLCIYYGQIWKLWQQNKLQYSVFSGTSSNT